MIVQYAVSENQKNMLYNIKKMIDFCLWFYKSMYLCSIFQSIRRKMTITLNKQSRASIEKITGIPYDDLLAMDVEEIDVAIEKKIGKKLKFKPVTDFRLIGRGSVYLYLNRLFDFNAKKLNRYIDRIK